MKKIFCFISAVLWLLLAACGDQNKSVYEACCGAEPTVDSFRINFPTFDSNGNIIDPTSAAKVYIPNIFTTDNSGVSNLFMVFGGLTVVQVLYIRCSDEQGNQLFFDEKFQPNDSGHAWDGLKADGSIYQGSFNYEVKYEFVDGQTRTYTGKACAYDCSHEGFPTDQVPGCFFPAQHDGFGGLDKSLQGYDRCF